MSKKFMFLAAALVLAGCSQAPEPSNVAGTPIPQSSVSQNAWTVTNLPSTPLLEYRTSHEIDSQELRKPIVINLWASWCAACASEMPLIADSEFAKDVVAINVGDLALSSAGKNDAAALVASTHGAFPIYIDTKDALMKALKINGLPVTFAVNSSNQIVDYEIGELTNESLKRLVHASKS